MPTYNLGPCGCCAIYDCECYEIEPTEVKVTLSGFTGACAAWNGEYIFSTPARFAFETFGPISLLMSQGCENNFWGLAVQVSASESCGFAYEVLESAEDTRFSCSGGTLLSSDLIGSDVTTCPDCAAGSVNVEIIM